jgi:voltage-gated potassium channel
MVPARGGVACRPMVERTDTLAGSHAVRERARARWELRQFMRRLAVVLVALNLLVIAGTVGFAIIEGTSVAYGFVWTLDTITTVGSIPIPADAGGRALKVGLELLGVGTLFYGLATIAEFFVSGQLSGVLDERRMEKMIRSYTDHYIVCGFGRVGRQVARDLLAEGGALVVIDASADNREAAHELDLPFILEEPADDEALQGAGIESARAVIACVDSDAENIGSGDTLVAIGSPEALERLDGLFQPATAPSA